MHGWTLAAGAAALMLPVMAFGQAPVQVPASPAPSANGEMGFVVSAFLPSFLEDPTACPQGTTPKIKDVYLQSLASPERKRLSLKENESELTKRWQASVVRPDGTNVCSQPERFDRPMLLTVQSRKAPGLDLDGDGLVQSCAHEAFTGIAGEAGVDNQVYRALGCILELRGPDGKGGDSLIGMKQFFASGQWTQVILLRGVDSLEDDPEVEVVYANTADVPMVDGKGEYLPGASFTVSDKAPRYRNVLKGRIAGGVLTTLPSDIKLTQTWGQGGARDIRGNRTAFDLRSGRLRLKFQPDGSLDGMVGGYQPVFDLIQSPAIGGAGAATTAGIDCAAELRTLKALADGIRDPKTGQCSGVSSAYQVKAVPAFVNDLPTTRTAAR